MTIRDNLTLRRLLPVVVSFSVLALLFARMDLRAVVAAVDTRSVLTLAAVLPVFGALTLAIDAISLVRILPPEARHLSLGTAARIKAASYLLGTVHYALGAGAFSFLLARRAALGLSSAVGVTLLISSLDLGILLLLGLAGSAALGTEEPALRATVVAAVGLVLVAGFAVLRTRRSLGPLEWLRSLAVLRALATTPAERLAEVSVLRTLFVVTFVGLVAFALRGFGIAVPIPELAVGVAVILLVAALPISAAGLGTVQAAFLFVFRHHARPETLLACSLALTAGLLVLRGGIGALFAREYAREASSAAPHEEAG